MKFGFSVNKYIGEAALMYTALGKVARDIPSKTNFLNITVFVKNSWN